MKKIIYPLIGAVIAGAICNIIFWSIGRMALAFDMRLYNGEEESARNFVIFLIFFLLSITIGCIYGYYVAKKS